MWHVLGIDGGGTGTRAIAVGEDGTVLGTGASGPGNWRDVGVEGAVTNITAACRAATGGLEARPRQRVAGLAGLDPEKDAIAYEALLAGLEADDVPLLLENDLRIALEGGLAGAPGLVVIAGTGSACYGRNGRGETHRAGGWGRILDDAGSAYDIGRRALTTCARALDGRGERPGFERRILAALGVQGLRDVLPLLEGERARRDVAALAPLVARAAESGDPVATSVLHAAARELVDAVVITAETLGLAEPSIAISGSLARIPVYASVLRERLDARLTGPTITVPLLPPVGGAAILALREAGVEVTPRIISTLKRGIFAAESA